MKRNESQFSLELMLNILGSRIFKEKYMDLGLRNLPEKSPRNKLH